MGCHSHRPTSRPANVTGRNEACRTRGSAGDGRDSVAYLNLADPYPLHRMITLLAQDGGRAAAGGQDVGLKVRSVDRVPEVAGLPDRLARRQLGVAGEVGARVAERRLAQPQEALTYQSRMSEASAST